MMHGHVVETLVGGDNCPLMLSKVQKYLILIWQFFDFGNQGEGTGDQKPWQHSHRTDPREGLGEVADVVQPGGPGRQEDRADGLG